MVVVWRNFQWLSLKKKKSTVSWPLTVSRRARHPLARTSWGLNDSLVSYFTICRRKWKSVKNWLAVLAPAVSFGVHFCNERTWSWFQLHCADLRVQTRQGHFKHPPRFHLFQELNPNVWAAVCVGGTALALVRCWWNPTNSTNAVRRGSLLKVISNPR